MFSKKFNMFFKKILAYMFCTDNLSSRIPHYGNPGKLTGIRLTIELAMSEPGENQVVAKTV